MDISDPNGLLGHTSGTCDNGIRYRQKRWNEGSQITDPITIASPLREDSMSHRVPAFCLSIIIGFAITTVAPAYLATDVGDLAPISYNKQIRPILSNNCFPCHGPDSAARKAGLRLDNAEDAYRDRDGFAAVTPGNSTDSLMIERIFSEDTDDIMPPTRTHKQVPRSDHTRT